MFGAHKMNPFFVALKFLKLLQIMVVRLSSHKLRLSQHNNYHLLPDSTHTIALLRLDAIGDYILFRPFLKIIRESDAFRNSEITLIGNMQWKELAENLDAEYIDNFIWIDVTRFKTSLTYFEEVKKNIRSQSYSILLNATYSRSIWTDESMAGLILTEKKIAINGNSNNMYTFFKWITSRQYSTIIHTTPFVSFEMLRTKEFFAKLLNAEITIPMHMPEVNTSILENISNPFVVLFLGASSPVRKWPVDLFVQLGVLIHDTFGCQIVLCGDQNDLTAIDSTKRFVVNLTGKTSLVDMVALIRNAEFMVSNETCMPHIAAQLHTPCFTLYNGVHYGRFTPYPIELSQSTITILHPEIQKDTALYADSSNIFQFQPTYDISEISVGLVFQVICEYFKNL